MRRFNKRSDRSQIANRIARNKFHYNTNLVSTQGPPSGSSESPDSRRRKSAETGREKTIPKIGVVGKAEVIHDSIVKVISR